MSWDMIFLLANYWAFAGWIALAFLPRGPKILAAILYVGVFLLCLAYTGLIVGFLTARIGPGRGRWGGGCGGRARSWRGCARRGPSARAGGWRG